MNAANIAESQNKNINSFHSDQSSMNDKRNYEQLVSRHSISHKFQLPSINEE